MPRPSELLIATTNPGKLKELKDLLKQLPVKPLSLHNVKSFEEIEETGETFRENAELKASGYARQACLLTIADDSGLEVDALGSRPGVLSARYGGAEMAFAEKITLLLAELDKLPGAYRSARFVCSVALADAAGRIVFAANGICRGSIARKPRGQMGFGYDPIFIPNGYDQTFGELSDAVKQKISHRALAFGQIIPFLHDYIVI